MFLQLAFSATSTTIISGAMAERLYLSGYVFFCFFMCSFIYPVVVGVDRVLRGLAELRRRRCLSPGEAPAYRRMLM